ncbi:WD40-repeat-containing domain protein, partial [Protomyces lactucae-debilis]
QVYRGHTAPVTCSVVASHLYITGSWDKTIRVFDKASRQCLHVLVGHADFIKCLLYIPSLGLLLSGSSDRTIRVWCLQDFKCLYTLKAHPRAVEQLYYVRDVLVYGPYIITACRDEQIRLFEGGSGKLKFTLEGHFSEITGLAIVGQTLFSVSIDCTLRRWDL